MNKPHPDEVPGLAALRFLAAFSVVIAHGAAVLMHGHERPGSLAYWCRQASGFGMTLFFVLSGFVIHYNYASLVTEGRLRGISVYLWARFTRLWQLHAHWMSPLSRESANAMRFFAGYSLAEALFMKDYRMIDLLPFSRLYAPNTIDSYLAIKWSDGSTILLTWIGPDTTPFSADFLEAFKRLRAQPDALRWLKFDELAPLIATIAPPMRSVTKWGAAQTLFSWR